MSEFDKWVGDNFYAPYDVPTPEQAFEAGQQSQQAKIDDSENTRAVLYRENMDLRDKNIDLQAKIDEMQEQLRIEREQGTEYFTDTHSLISERDELQARVDDALRHVVDHGGYDDLTHVISILKGNKDD